ncbi:methionyl-tRNA formyltransferase [Maribacter sp. 4U21]|uniref:methionyl-tRNA formyltransferase n=1 Tax=Maribacter sp. 4U21 TaxID=1889779 RepID=UPI000C14633A|nr:methionyl-tRNA formyltransferase [Maribacter sp. 4U21]PIB25522.1 methionyl-tRNA formyltransferase [Maribacter sp. 4U21]
MKELRIVFMGTPDFAVGVLDSLVRQQCNIVGVITAPDRPAGRGRRINESAVKKYALEKRLTILQPTNLKDDTFLRNLEDLKANLQIVVAFRMLPKNVWVMPEYGTFNLHASLLPQYRGAAPINWAIMNGETKTGVTTFFIDEKIDTGAIILQEEAPIYIEDNVEALHDRLMTLGAQLVLKTVERIKAGNFKTILQKDKTDLKLAHKLQRETCVIDWNRPAKKVYDFIRGLSPYPGAWSTLYNEKEEILTKIFKTELQLEQHNLKPGTILSSKKEMKVAVKDGYIKLLEIQLQGKKRMAVQDVLNGLQIAQNAHFG